MASTPLTLRRALAISCALFAACTGDVAEDRDTETQDNAAVGASSGGINDPYGSGSSSGGSSGTVSTGSGSQDGSSGTSSTDGNGGSVDMEDAGTPDPDERDSGAKDAGGASNPDPDPDPDPEPDPKPDPNQASIDRGRTLFASMCSGCHGAAGRPGASRAFDDLVKKINDTMPKGNAKACVDQCAVDAARYIQSPK